MAELDELDALSTEMGANKLADSLQQLYLDLTPSLKELVEVLQLDSSTPSHRHTPGRNQETTTIRHSFSVSQGSSQTRPHIRCG